MKERMLRLGLAALVALGVPAAAAAGGSGNASGGLSVADQKTSDAPTSAGKPEGAEQGDENDDTGQPEDAGRPTTNHGYFVSQIAKDNSTTGKAHGEAVRAVAKGDQGKPSAATGHH